MIGAGAGWQPPAGWEGSGAGGLAIVVGIEPDGDGSVGEIVIGHDGGDLFSQHRHSIGEVGLVY
jgi:hypothetical protein